MESNQDWNSLFETIVQDIDVDEASLVQEVELKQTLKTLNYIQGYLLQDQVLTEDILCGVRNLRLYAEEVLALIVQSLCDCEECSEEECPDCVDECNCEYEEDDL